MTNHVNPEQYTYSIDWSEPDKEYVGLCAEFPSLSHLAKTQGEALNGITKLVAAVLEDMEAPPPVSMFARFERALRQLNEAARKLFETDPK